MGAVDFSGVDRLDSMFFAIVGLTNGVDLLALSDKTDGKDLLFGVFNFSAQLSIETELETLGSGISTSGNMIGICDVTI